MPLLSNMKPDSRFIGLFVSRSGNGKTGAACSFPGPIKVLDFDERIQGALGCPWLQKKFDHIDYTVYPPIPADKQANSTKLQKLFEAWMLTPFNQFPYKTVVLDSLTSTARAMLREAIPISNAGRKVGDMLLAGPGDYGYEAQGIDNVLSFLRSLPIQNLIVSAHVVPKFGKPKIETGRDKGMDNPYAENIEIGEKLSVRDKVGENSLIYFDHVLKFDREEAPDGNSMKYFVTYRSDLAKTSFSKAPMREDITGKDFYDEVIKKYMVQEQVQST